jgi:hypothetical protein
LTGPLFSETQLRRLTVEALKELLRGKLGGMVRAIKDIRPDNRVYRGVECTDRPDLISRISFPPPGRVSQWGRLNRPGESVFYASAAPPGVFYELKAQAGQFIAFSEWEVMEPLWMHNLGYHSDALARLGASPTDLRQVLTDPIPNETARNRRLRKQVAMAFTEDVAPGREHRYHQSVAIKEFWCEHHQHLAIYPDGPRSPLVAGIVYPSLQMRGDADNIAFWPQFALSSLRLRQVQHVLVETADPQRQAFTFLTLALSKGFEAGSRILWKDELPPEAARRCHIALEDGAWVMRDGFGQPYRVHPQGRAVVVG